MALTLGLGATWAAAQGSPPHTSLQGIRDQLLALRARRELPPALPGYQEFRGVLHVHTGLSGDSRGSVEEILAAARTSALQFLITTDHYTPRIFTEGVHGVRESVLIVRGMELPLGCTRERGLARRCGSLLAIGLREPLNPDILGKGRELFDAIHAQGGLAIIAHPRGIPDARAFELADGIEIYDIADAARDRLVDVPRYALTSFMTHEQYQDELLLPIVDRLNWHLVQWDHLTRTRRVVGLAGNDAHQNIAVFGRQVDPYPLVFRALHTHVLAPSLSMEDLMNALRAGRCFSAFNLLADAAGFQFVALQGAIVVALLGEEIPLQEELILRVQSPIPGVLVLFRDGSPVRRVEGRELWYPVDRPGVYRVEVSLKVLDRWRPWIFANPIYVR